MLMHESQNHIVPHIRTPLPGPKAQALIAADERYTSPSYTRAYPLAVERGYGAVIEDVDGNRFLDFTAGIAVCSTGHCHPRIVEAIRRQSEKLLHMSGTDFYYAPQGELAARLAELAPGPEPKRVFFTNSGAESVEAAFKLARHHSGRQQMIAFFGAFHGRTMGALSLTGSKVVQRRGFAPLVPMVHHIDYPNAYRVAGHEASDAQAQAAATLETLNQLEDLFKRTVPADEVAAIIVEPIQGEGGYIVPPPQFHRELKAIAERHGILYIADEVQTGMGRTGKMFAMEHFGVTPDIVCLAKGIASGMPLGAMIARADIMDWGPGSHASTFGGNPISCVAALETIHVLQDGLMDSAATTGQYLMEELRTLQERHPLIGEVRGIGLMAGMELVRDRQTKEPAPAERERLVQEAFRRGLLLLGCGESTVRFCPPLVVTQAEVDTAVSILDDVLKGL
jgi:4-aminobutyrate aminotransferase